MKKQILFKTLFHGWKKLNEKEALDLAKFKMSRIKTGNEETRLELINNRFKGIQFTLESLV